MYIVVLVPLVSLRLILPHIIELPRDGRGNRYNVTCVSFVLFNFTNGVHRLGDGGSSFEAAATRNDATPTGFSFSPPSSSTELNSKNYDYSCQNKHFLTCLSCIVVALLL